MTRRLPRLRDPLWPGLLVLAVAGVVLYISYTAQNGLPWEASHRVGIAVPDAGKLSKNAEVRVGGARVGQVLSIEAVPRRGDTPPHALLDVRLDGDAGPLPVDTTAEVRLASVLGGKYLALVPGRSRRTVPEDGRLPLRNASTSIDIEEAFGIFDPRGRAAMRAAVGGFADAVAGRGTAINETIDLSAQLLPGLQRVLATLSARRTDLPGFVRGAAAGMTAVAAAGPDLGPMVGHAARTFGAVERAGDALGEGIAELPTTARVATGALGTLGPVLDDAAAIARDLRPAADVLPSAARGVDAATRAATRVAPVAGSLAAPLDRTLRAVGTFTANPSAAEALELLGPTDLGTFGASAFVGLGAILTTTWEAERHCRAASTWMSRLSGVFSDGDAGGNWLRMIPIVETGQGTPKAEPSPDLHANPYPIADATECEAGNEGYGPGRQIGNPPGHQGRPEGSR